MRHGVMKMKDDKLRYTLRIDPLLMSRFAYVAEYNGRTKTKEIEQLIKRHIAEFEKENGEIDLSTLG
jgi:predicted DNA-binding protein